MLSLVGDFTGERIAEILGEELTGSLIENSGEDLREEGEMLQLRMDQWKVAVNPQVQKAAEAAERSRVVPGVEIADDYEPSREEVAHHWGVSAEKVAWAELGEEDWIMSLRRCWLRVSHASGALDHMLERPKDELEITAMKRFPAVNPSPSSVAPEPRVDVDFLGPRGQSTWTFPENFVDAVLLEKDGVRSGHSDSGEEYEVDVRATVSENAAMFSAPGKRHARALPFSRLDSTLLHPAIRAALASGGAVDSSDWYKNKPLPLGDHPRGNVNVE